MNFSPLAAGADEGGVPRWREKGGRAPVLSGPLPHPAAITAHAPWGTATCHVTPQSERAIQAAEEILW